MNLDGGAEVDLSGVMPEEANLAILIDYQRINGVARQTVRLYAPLLHASGSGGDLNAAAMDLLSQIH